MAATGYTPISLYYSTTASAVPTAGNLVAGELAININDGKLYFKNSSNVVTLLASSSGASGDVVGPASATNNGVALFDGTTGKLIKNSSSFVQSGSNVGIGTTSPTYQLDVNWNAGSLQRGRFVNISNSAAAGVMFQLENDAGNSLQLLQYSSTYTNANEAIIQQNTGGQLNIKTLGAFPILLGTNNTERMRIDSSGNVGIGTSSPSVRLDVNGGRSYFAANNEPYSIGVRYNGSTNGVFIGSPSADTLTISSWGGTERMRIDSSGNVGIGTSSPGSKLNVVGTNGSIRMQDSAGTAKYIQMRSDSTNSHLEHIGGPGDALRINNQAAGTVEFYTSNTERMRIDSSGSVGINATTNLRGNLEVRRASLSAFTGTSLGNIVVSDSAATADYFVPIDFAVIPTTGTPPIARIAAQRTGSGSYLYFGTSSNYSSGITNSAMVIDYVGNVGINVTSPVTRLDVNGIVTIRNNGGTFNTTPNTNYGLNFQATNSGDTYITSYSSGGSTALAFATNSGGGAAAERFRIDSTGNALFAKAVRATITTDNDLSFDMNAASNFKCTPTAGGALTFTNITSGQTGNIILVNNSNYAITAAATTKVSSTCLATISATGTYWLSYYSDGTNVYVANTGALA